MGLNQFKSLTLTSLLIVFSGGLAMASNLDRAKDIFNRVDKNNMHLIAEFYAPDAEFQDPIHKLKGVKAIEAYYAGLYKNVDSIRFEYKNSSEADNFVTLEWTMRLRTPSLNSGKEVTLDGTSLIKFDPKSGMVTHHRDYFDMGEFIYERVPLLRSVIGYIKSKMKGE